jgi:hypothetical protein
VNDKKSWHTASTVLAVAALLNRVVGLFGQTVTAWLSFGSAVCGLIAAA